MDHEPKTRITSPPGPTHTYISIQKNVNLAATSSLCKQTPGEWARNSQENQLPSHNKYILYTCMHTYIHYYTRIKLAHYKSQSEHEEKKKGGERKKGRPRRKK